MVFDPTFIIVGLMQVVGFFVQGCTGFGCTVIAAPVTNGLLGTAAGVPYGTLLTIPFLYFLAIRSWREVSWKDLAKIIGLCAPGILVGNWLYATVLVGQDNLAKVLIGGIVTFIALMNIWKVIIAPLVLKQRADEDKPDIPVARALRYVALVAGGIVHGAFNIGGPLITVYTISAVREKEKFRNTMNMVWVILNTWNMATQFMNGSYTPTVMGALAIGFPCAAVGFAVGMAFLKKINRETFLRIVYVVLFIVGFSMFFQSLMALL